MNLKKINFLIFLVILLPGCASYQKNADVWLDDVKNQQYHDALKKIDGNSKSTNEVLDSLNKGLVYRHAKQWDLSNQHFEKAIEAADKLRAASVSESVGSNIVSESLRSYVGAYHEILSAPIYKAYNFIDMRDCTAARVEAKRINELMSESLANKEPKQVLPWAVFFTGLMYELMGDNNDARVSYRQAEALYKKTNGRITDIGWNGTPDILAHSLRRVQGANERNRSCEDFGKRPSLGGKAELLLIYHHGLVTKMHENIISHDQPKPVGLIKVALPAYGPTPKLPAAVAYLSNEPKSNLALDLVANYEALARAELKENLPEMQRRLITRLVLRKTATTVAEKAGEKKGGVMENIGTIMRIADTALTLAETADTRSWPLAPSAVFAARKITEPGQHILRIKAGDHFVEIPVNLEPGKLTLLNVTQMHPTKPPKNTVPISFFYKPSLQFQISRYG